MTKDLTDEELLANAAWDGWRSHRASAASMMDRLFPTDAHAIRDTPEPLGEMTSEEYQRLTAVKKPAPENIGVMINGCTWSQGHTSDPPRILCGLRVDQDFTPEPGASYRVSSIDGEQAVFEKIEDSPSGISIAAKYAENMRIADGETLTEYLKRTNPPEDDNLTATRGWVRALLNGRAA